MADSLTVKVKKLDLETEYFKKNDDANNSKEKWKKELFDQNHPLFWVTFFCEKPLRLWNARL